ncbi:MAG: cytochrome c3 family protein [Candidatus Tectomicrobia bacterium]|uniref:Cytochrome c3 family protein n=1 Tax=Tectimicrobiota bacterium TaxID=2528274 RepID=A0A932CML6_UNCTE|nr:cytochrome c3 family protein [Candidatus Tectomicrobia bacterium]
MYYVKGLRVGFLLILLGLGGGAVERSWAQAVEVGSCQECHSREKEKKLRNPVPLWQKSIHAAHQVSCDGCHGGDPKAGAKEAAKLAKNGYLGKPEEEQIPDFCGQCHGTERENFFKGPHGEALKEGEDAPVCTACHGSHRVRSPDLEKIITEEACSDCHEFPDSQKIKDSLIRINGRLRKAELLLGEVWRKGMDVDPMRRELQSVKEEVEKLAHEMAVNRTVQQEPQLASAIEKAMGNLSRLDREADRRRLAGAVSIGFLLVGLIVAIGYRRTLHS